MRPLATYRSKARRLSAAHLPGLLDLLSQRPGASPEVRAARALEHFSNMHQMLVSGEKGGGINEGLRGFGLAGVPVNRDLKRWLQAAAGQSPISGGPDQLDLPLDVLACSRPALMAVVRGLCFLGAYQAAAGIRDVGRQKYLEMDSAPGTRDWITTLTAQSELGNHDLVREELLHLADQRPVSRGLRSVALGVGWRDGAMFGGCQPRSETAGLVRGAVAVVEGPLANPRPEVREPSQVRARFKYLGRLREEPGTESCDISIINGHAFPELIERFGDGGARHVMSPCRLVLYKNKSAPPVRLDAICEQLGARPALLCDKANLGLMAIEEILLAGAARVHVTGMDLWTGPVTADRSYPFFDRQNRQAIGGGLTSASVACSAGIHEPISHLRYLQNLREIGLITVDERLAGVLDLSDFDYAAALERRHGFPFAARAEGVT